jgi:IgGFc binding protein
MPRWLRLASFSVLVACLILACGSRTGLSIPEPGCEDNHVDCEPAADARAEEGAGDHTIPPPPPPADARVDRPGDGPLFEGGKLDVVTDCGQPPYCDPRDPGFVYQCGVRIEQCSSLEQCAQIGGEAGVAQCVNPCLDTLGQDTSNGCEFYAAEMDVTDETAGVCYAVYIVNQWKTGEPAKIQVDRGGTLLDVSQFARIPVGTGLGIQYTPFDARAGLAKDQIAILFLSRDPNATGASTDPRVLAGCPPGVVPAVPGDAALHGTGIGTAFHIKTNVPVVAYQILPYGGGRARVTAATLLLPVNVWDTNYIAVNASPEPDFVATSPRAGPTMVVIASQDATSVSINPVRPIVGGGALSGGPANVTRTYALNKGQYLQFTQGDELTGSPIEANKPVALIGGSTLMQVPVGRRRADTAEQMIAPVQALGNEYVAVRFRARRTRDDEAVPWRIVGAVNGTVLRYEPARPAGAPPEINRGEVAQFESAGPFVVKSQDPEHPFYFAGYMTGGDKPPFGPGTTESADDGEGDAEFVNVVPPAQYLPRYTFFTDPTYPETNLVIVRTRDPGLGVFPDVALDCSGTLGGWADVGTSGTYQFTRVDLSTANWNGVGGCDNGVHTLQAVFPGLDSGVPVPRFGVTVWGWGNTITLPNPDDSDPRSTRWVSYAYPAGANFTKLNSVIVPAR